MLWNAVVSLYECNKAIKRPSRYYILPNIPEDVETKAVDVHKSRLELLRALGNRDTITIVDEDERAMIIERVAATVRGRQTLAETDRSAVKKLDDIYLIIPNQQLFAAKMGRVPKGLEGLDSNLPISTETKEAKSRDAQPADMLGSEGLVMPGSDDTSGASALGFLSVDCDSFDSHSNSIQNSENISIGKLGRNLDEELRYILEYGPTVNVHVLLQSTSPDKIYADDSMREKEMNMLFNDMVFLKMLSAGSMSLPIDSRKIEQLSSDPKSLRAIAYNTGRGARTIVPFTIPKLD